MKKAPQDVCTAIATVASSAPRMSLEDASTANSSQNPEPTASESAMEVTANPHRAAAPPASPPSVPTAVIPEAAPDDGGQAGGSIDQRAVVAQRHAPQNISAYPGPTCLTDGNPFKVGFGPEHRRHHPPRKKGDDRQASPSSGLSRSRHPPRAAPASGRLGAGSGGRIATPGSRLPAGRSIATAATPQGYSPPPKRRRARGRSPHVNVASPRPPQGSDPGLHSQRNSSAQMITVMSGLGETRRRPQRAPVRWPPRKDGKDFQHRLFAF